MIEVITALLVSYSAPKAIPAQEIAPAIMKAAVKHRVSAILLTRIILIESKGLPGAFNAETIDHGLLQINERTRIAYGLTQECLADWRCNLDAGAKILSDMLAMAGGRACAYNVGPRGRFKKYETACLRYESRLEALN